MGRIYMKKLFYGAKVSVITALIMCAVMGAYTFFYNQTAQTRVKQGSDSAKVILVQEKLKELGLYDGKCDGVYDIDTADAVRRFQEYNGIYADGVCGNETLQKLGLSIYTYSEFELDVLAKLIEAEVGKGDLQTKTAFGAVVMNRVKSGAFPDTVLQVIYANGAFDSVTNNSIKKAKPSEQSYRAAEDALMGYDPTDGAVYVFKGSADGKNITLQCGNVYFAK
ncbi:MAG: spore cortex-lytic enzyme [Ruminococcaceae bacterium]|nr:spore cortex-lytic enzyme [Oscillospiraceae bacterium]